jgi:regulator of ribosome biosynthesis
MSTATLTQSEVDTAVSNLSPNLAATSINTPFSTTTAAINGEKQKPKYLPVTVEPPIPYTTHLQSLLVLSSNPLPPHPSEEQIQSSARDAAQHLINTLLTTCPAKSTTTSVILSLPNDAYPLPREKPLPAAKEKTRWEKFAEKKGIVAKRRDDRANREWDAEKGDWVKKWGFGRKKHAEDEWAVEVPEREWRKEESEGKNVRSLRRGDRKEIMKRKERRERANVKRAAKKE